MHIVVCSDFALTRRWLKEIAYESVDSGKAGKRSCVSKIESEKEGCDQLYQQHFGGNRQRKVHSQKKNSHKKFCEFESNCLSSVGRK